MLRAELRGLLERFRSGAISEDELIERLVRLPFRELGGGHQPGGGLDDVRLDTSRALRQGVPEVILGAGKTAEQIARIAGALIEEKCPVLVTRVDPALAAAVRQELPALAYEEVPRLLIATPDAASETGRGTLAVISAGTSDVPVAEEAARTAELLGNRVERIYDVGVAGLHRLLAELDALRSARVLIVVAGMEGALASVVGGLVDRPVIAVPTSQGYGAAFGGLAALLAMLNACSSNVAVVNIDNGFGAAFVASRINHD